MAVADILDMMTYKKNKINIMNQDERLEPLPGSLFPNLEEPPTVTEADVASVIDEYVPPVEALSKHVKVLTDEHMRLFEELKALKLGLGRVKVDASVAQGQNDNNLAAVTRSMDRILGQINTLANSNKALATTLEDLLEKQAEFNKNSLQIDQALEDKISILKEELYKALDRIDLVDSGLQYVEKKLWRSSPAPSPGTE